MSEDELAARYEGIFMTTGRRVYGRFGRGHVVTTEMAFEVFDWTEDSTGRPHPPHDWSIYNALDPHDGKPWAMIWVAVSPPFQRERVWNEQVRCYDESAHIVFREYPLFPFHRGGVAEGNRGIGEYADIVKKTEAGEEIQGRVIDPKSGASSFRTSEGKSTVLLELAKYGLFYQDGAIGLDNGHQHVRNALTYDYANPVDPRTNMPRLMICEWCSNTIRFMENYVWAKRAGSSGEIKRNANGLVPDEQYKDFPDLVRYHECAQFQWIPLQRRRDAGRWDKEGWETDAEREGKNLGPIGY